MVARAGRFGVECGSTINGCRVSLWGDDDVLESNSGADYTTL